MSTTNDMPIEDQLKEAQRRIAELEEQVELLTLQRDSQAQRIKDLQMELNAANAWINARQSSGASRTRRKKQ